MQSDFLRRMPGIGPATAGQERGLLERMHVDPILLLVLYMMSAIGIIVLYSAGAESQYLISRQVAYLGVGTVAMLVVAQIPPLVMQRLAWLAYAGGIVMLGIVLIAGTGAKGAQRWVDLGIIQFQPSEVIKFALPMFIASYLSQRAMPIKFKHLCWALIIIVIPVALILFQPDLGTAILVAGSGLVVLFLAGLRWRYIISALALAPVAVIGAWVFLLHDYQKQRVCTLLDPYQDPLGKGFHIIQGMIAIGSGGILGKGFMQGTQTHLEFIPERTTDFIYAAFSEEFGLIGTTFLVVGLVFLIVRGLMIAMEAPTLFSRLLAGSLTLNFFVYGFVNMGMVSGILPVVGVPLPFISYGGTAMVTLGIGLGILMSIARTKRLMQR